MFDHLLAMHTRRVDTLPLVEEAWELRHNLTVDDALYVVVARRLSLPFVTGNASSDLGRGTQVPRQRQYKKSQYFVHS